MNRTPVVASLAAVAALGMIAAPTAEARIDPPKAHCTIAPKKQYSFDTLLKRGIRVPVTCDAPAKVRVIMRFFKPFALADRMPGRGYQDLNGNATFASAGTKVVTVKMSPRSRARIRRSDKLASGTILAAVGDPDSKLLRTVPKDGRQVRFTR